MNQFPVNHGKIIAIGGVSRSGKSALANWLLQELIARGHEAVVLSQDEYCLPEEKLPLIKNLPDWETPDSMDWDNYHQTVEKLLRRKKIILVEGIFVFDDAVLINSYAIAINMVIDKSTFLERRKLETRWGQEPQWFIEHVWNAYHQRIFKFPRNTMTLSGTEAYSSKKLVDYVLSD